MTRFPTSGKYQSTINDPQDQRFTHGVIKTTIATF